MSEWSFFQPSFYGFQSGWSSETNGFPLGQENVIEINSEQMVAIISNWIWKFQKLSSEPNILKFGKQTSKYKQQGNLSWVDFWSHARQQKQTNGSGVINVHFKPTSGHAKHNLSAIYKCKLRESLAIWA